MTRFAVAEPDAAWVMRLLAGAALAGAEPCQYQPDTDAASSPRRRKRSATTVVVTRRTTSGPARSTSFAPTSSWPTIRTCAFVSSDGPQPLVIRTTGTTGAPKAARHDWRVLAQTVANIPPRPDQRWLLAYGPHQFAGIQVLLHVVASQATLVAPFPRQPSDGPEALLSEGVTCVSATPTYWRFLRAEAPQPPSPPPPAGADHPRRRGQSRRPP